MLLSHRLGQAKECIRRFWFVRYELTQMTWMQLEGKGKGIGHLCSLQAWFTDIGCCITSFSVLF